MSSVNTLQAPAAAGEQRLQEPSMEDILASIRRIISDDQSLPTPSVQGDGALRPERADPVPAPPLPSQVHVLRPDPVPPVVEPLVAESPKSAAALAPEQRPQGAAAPATKPVPDDVETLAASVRPSPKEPAAGTPLAGPRPAAKVAAPPMPPRQNPALAPHVAAPPKPMPPLPSPAPSEPASRMVDSHVPPPRRRDPDIAADIAVPEMARRREPMEPEPLFSTATDQAVTAAFNTLAATRLADNSEELMTLAREMIRPMLRTWLDDNLPAMVERMVRAEIERVARGGR